jgi:uncharacterized protein YlxP (DUF503 family)
MVIGVVIVQMHLPGASSLKDKRKIILSLKDRLKNKFNVSVAELDDNELWQRCTLGIALISNDGTFANTVLSKAIDVVSNHPEAIVTDINLEWR